jgi:hypothetical protein
MSVRPAPVSWVLHPSSCYPAPCRHVPDVMRPAILRIVVLRLVVLHPVIMRPAVLRPAFSSNIYLTPAQYLCVTSHSQLRTLFFKSYIVLGFCS